MSENKDWKSRIDEYESRSDATKAHFDEQWSKIESDTSLSDEEKKDKMCDSLIEYIEAFCDNLKLVKGLFANGDKHDD